MVGIEEKEKRNEIQDDIFDNIEKTEYVVLKGGIKVPFSEFDKPLDYYDKFKQQNYTKEEYIHLMKFKNKTIALYDKRWKSAKEVIDLIAKFADIDPERTDKQIYGFLQKKDGVITCHLKEELEKWFEKSGEKTKLKKRITELENQVEMLKSMLRRE